MNKGDIANGNAELQALLDRQEGLVSRTQLTNAGCDEPTFRRYRATGRLRPVLPNVFVTLAGELAVEQQRIAASLYTAGVGQLTGIAALAWHGLRDLPHDDRLHLLILHGGLRRPSYDFVRVQRTRRMDLDVVRANGYAVCSPARAAADACRSLTDLEAVAAIVKQVVGDGWSTVGALRKELELAGASRTRQLRAVLRGYDDTPPTAHSTHSSLDGMSG